MNGNSLFGNCLDGKDLGVRLDLYMYEGWKVRLLLYYGIQGRRSA